MLESRTKIDAFLGKTPRAIKKIEEILANKQALPENIALQYELLELVSDYKTSNAELISVLTQDPGLANRIIEKARLQTRFNKARISASQLTQSIQRLGYERICEEMQNDLLTRFAAIFRKTDNEDLRSIVKRSIRRALVARELCKTLEHKEVIPSFFAALNFELGHLLIVFNDEKSYEEIKKMLAKGMERHAAQMAVLGYEERELAARMLEQEQLPELIIDLVNNADRPNKTKEHNRKIATLVALADYITRGLFEGQSRSPYAMWDRAHEYLQELGSDLKMEQWANEIKAIYIKVMSAEHGML